MYALWKSNDVYVGPIGKRKITIMKGEIRKVHAKSNDGKFILAGKNNKGFYGWIEPEDIIVAETKEELEKIKGI